MADLYDHRLQQLLEPVGMEGPGVAVAVVERGEVTGFAAAGMANIEHGVAIDRSTVHYLASTSKQFVGMAIALLEAAGSLSLADDIREHIPELKNLPERVEIAHLLHHTSGIRDKYSLASIGSLAESACATDDGTLALLARQRTLNFKPGTRFMYSNSGYFLLAQIVERVSGLSLRSYASKHIFEPLGMASTVFRDDPDEPLLHRASGYRRAGESWRIAEYRYPSLGPGGAWSTVDDMAAWSYALDNERLVPLERVLRTQPLSDGASNSYAFGLMLADYRGERAQQHAGGVQGHTADFMRFPDRSLTVIAFANGGGNASTFSRQVADVVIGGDVEVATPTKPPSPTKSDLKGFLGTYVDDDFTATITIELEEDEGPVVKYGDVTLPVSKSGPDELAGSGFTIGLNDGELTVVFPWALDDRSERFTRLPPPTTRLTIEDEDAYESDELGVLLHLSVSDEGPELARDEGEPVRLEQVADDLYYWPVSAFGQSGELLLGVIRDPAGRAVALRTGAGRAVNVMFARRVSAAQR